MKLVSLGGDCLIATARRVSPGGGVRVAGGGQSGLRFRERTVCGAEAGSGRGRSPDAVGRSDFHAALLLRAGFEKPDVAQHFAAHADKGVLLLFRWQVFDVYIFVYLVCPSINNHLTLFAGCLPSAHATTPFESPC